MANNRLYIADTLNMEYMLIEKGWGYGWNGGYFDSELFKTFLKNRIDEGGILDDTNLIFFTENSSNFQYIMKNYNQITKQKFIEL